MSAIEKLNNEFAGSEVRIGNKIGKIESFVNVMETFNNEPDVKIVTVDTEGVSRSYMLKTAVKRSTISVDARLLSRVEEYMPEINEAYREFLASKEEEANKRAEARRLEEEQKKQLEIEKKNTEIMNSVINSANNLYRYVIPESDQFFTSLGYIAKHVKKISASMPDYIEDWFIKTFGKDAEKRVVDSKKIGPSGYTSQWRLSMMIDLDSNENMPAYLFDYLSNTSKKENKPISSTKFIYNIMKNYGFKFGKKQNLDDIKESIPENYRNSFEFGYSLS